MKNKPSISIIMSVYNNQETLDACITSIQNQSFIDWEFIICNDKSTDSSLEILKQKSQQDNRITVLNNKRNMGLAYSLNKCLSIVRGRYIARMDADDISKSDRLFKQYTFLETHKSVDILGTAMFISNGKRVQGIRRQDKIVQKSSFAKGSPFAHPTVMFRSDIVSVLKGYSTQVSRAEDLELWFRAYKSGFKGENLQEPLYIYHESIEDYKKRNLKAAIATSRVFLHGYKMLDFPLRERIFALKPIISAILPDKLLKSIHEIKLEEV